MKKYFQWTLAIVLIIAGAVLLAHAQGMPGKGMHRGRMFGRGMMVQRLARYLDLTEAQKAQIKSLAQAQRAANDPLRKQLAATREAMLTATAGGNFDQAKVSQIATQQAQIQAQLTVARQQLQSKIYNTVLTPDQKAKADELRQKQLSRIDQRLQKGEATTPKQ